MFYTYCTSLHLSNLKRGSGNAECDRVAHDLMYLGNVYRDLGYYEKAKKPLEQSFKIYKKNFSFNRVNIARVLGYIGDVYQSLGNLDKVRSLLEDSIAMTLALLAD